MKTKTFLFLILQIAAVNVFSQQISNSNFESWTNSVYFEDPPPYITTNSNSYMMLGSGNVTKSTDHNTGQFSARLETVQLGNDTMFGGMFLGTPGSSGITGGAAIAVHPDSLSVYVKYDLQPNDTAYILMLFKNNGVMIGIGAFAFAGTQSSFTQYKSKVTWYQPFDTDTVAVIITSSALDPPQFPGSTLYIDDLSFIGSLIPFPYGDFETWNTTGAEDPDEWVTMNYACFPGDPMVEKTTDSYDGTYAAKIKNVQMMSGDTMGFLTNGYLGNNGPQGGMHVIQNPEKLTGYYKYFPIGNDTALIGCFVYIRDSVGTSVIIDSGMISLPAIGTYTYFEVPFAYNGWPVADTLNISFTSGNLKDDNAYIGLGSTLYIDMLDLTYYPVALPESSEIGEEINIYPNPSSGNFTISFFSTKPEYVMDIYDTRGSLIYHKVLKHINGYFFYSFDLSEFAKGIYNVKFISEEKIITRKITIQ